MSALARTEFFNTPCFADPQSGSDLKLSNAAEPDPNDPSHIDDFTFDPPEEITTQILSDLAHSDCSMIDISRRAHTTLESLTRWMSRPDISARLEAIEATYTRRARLNIAACTPIMIEAAARIIRDYQNNESNFGSSNNPAHLATLRTTRQSALAACRILLRLKRDHAPAPSSTRATKVRRPGRTSVHSTSDANQTLELSLDNSRSANNDPCDKDSACDIALAPRPEGPQVRCRGLGGQPTELMLQNSSRDSSAEPQRGGSTSCTKSAHASLDSQASTPNPNPTTASPYPSASSPPRMHPPPESP